MKKINMGNPIETETITVYEKSIVGFGSTLFLNREPQATDVNFITNTYKAGRDAERLVIKNKILDLLHEIGISL